MPSAGPRFWARCLVAVFASALWAEGLPAEAENLETREAPEAKSTTPEESSLPDRVRTDTLGRGRAWISLRPHFGDLLNKDHFGVTVRGRYGISEDWEAVGRVNAYVAHGLGDVPAFSKVGISGVQVGLRRQLARQPESEVSVVAGMDYSRPVGRPPKEMADAFSHLTPHVIVSRRLESRPEWTTYVRVGLDFVTLTTPSAREEDDLAEDAWTITPGLNWERGDWSCTLEAHVRSSAGLGSGREHRVGLAPSVNWRLPAEWTPGRKGRWVLGLGVSVNHDGDKADVGVRGSLRTDFTLRELFGRGAARAPEKAR